MTSSRDPETTAGHWQAINRDTGTRAVNVTRVVASRLDDETVALKLNPSTFPIQNVKLGVKLRAVLCDKAFLALHRLYTVC